MPANTQTCHRIIVALLVGLLCACQPGIQDVWQQVSGQVLIPDASHLPEDAQLTVILEHQGEQQSPQVLAELRQQARQPMRFLLQNLQLTPKDYQQYRLHAQITSRDGRLLWRSEIATALTADNASTTLQLLPPPNARATTVFYRCDGEGLKITLEGDTATLFLAEQTYSLERVPSASGIHYQSWIVAG